jgi:magnesium and cobalt transporter
MSDTTNPSPGTTPDDEDTGDSRGPGLLTRLIGAFATPDSPDGGASPQGGPMPGMVNLRKLRVEDVAVPKADIIGASVALTLDELVDVFRTSGFSRIPVYDGTLDSPLGVVNLKDLALRHGFGQSGSFDLRGMLRSLLYVPPSMPAAILLQKMQSERTHMALVIDEYGGTDGLLTIEDLLETVVGEIEDEHDEDEADLFHLEKPGIWIAQAITPVGDFAAEIGVDLTAHDDIDGEEIDTLAGLVALIAGHLPVRGEVISHPAGVEFEVIDADPRRVKRLRVRRTGG